MAISWKYWLKNLLIQSIIILLSLPFGCLFVLVGYPILFILLFHRQCIIYLAKCRHSSWIPNTILGGMTAMDLRNESKIHTLGWSAEFDKSFDYQGFLGRMETLLNSNDRPELKCFLHKWMGIHFMVPCKDFDVSGVLSVNFVEDYENCDKILETFHNASFGKGNDPVWQICVFPNLKPNSVIVAFRTHHGLMDAMSLMSVTFQLADPNSVAEEKFKQTLSKITSKYLPKPSICSKLVIGLKLMTITPIYMVYKTLNCIQANMWSTANITEEVVQGRKVFQLKKLKEIANKLGHNVHTLFTGVLAGAIRSEMRARGDYSSLNQDIALGYVLPVPKHPHNKKLTTAANGTLLRLPTSIGDRKQRLNKVVKVFNEMKDPAWLLQCHIGMTFAGLFCPLLGFQRTFKHLSSGAWTNVAVWGSDRTLMNQPLSNLRIHSGLQVPHLPVMYLTYSFGNEYTLTVISDKSLFSNKIELDSFLKRIEYEINCYAEL